MVVCLWCLTFFVLFAGDLFFRGVFSGILKSLSRWKVVLYGNKRKASYFLLLFYFTTYIILSVFVFYVIGVGGAKFHSVQHQQHHHQHQHQHVWDWEGSWYHAIWQEDSIAWISDSSQLWSHGTYMSCRIYRQ